MSGMGIAIMGTGIARGRERARSKRPTRAISSPLLEDASVKGARGVIINVTGGPDLSLIEVSEASAIIQEAAHEDANIIFGAVVDPKMEGKVKITVIATGFDRADAQLDRRRPARDAGRSERTRMAREGGTAVAAAGGGGACRSRGGRCSTCRRPPPPPAPTGDRGTPAAGAEFEPGRRSTCRRSCAGRTRLDAPTQRRACRLGDPTASAGSPPRGSSVNPRSRRTRRRAASVTCRPRAGCARCCQQRIQ